MSEFVRAFGTRAGGLAWKRTRTTRWQLIRHRRNPFCCDHSHAAGTERGKAKCELTHHGLRFDPRRNGRGDLWTVTSFLKQLKDDTESQITRLTSGTHRIFEYAPDKEPIERTADQIAMLRRHVLELESHIKKAAR